jgi:hypothetical protein
VFFICHHVLALKTVYLHPLPNPDAEPDMNETSTAHSGKQFCDHGIAGTTKQHHEPIAFQPFPTSYTGNIVNVIVDM